MMPAIGQHVRSRFDRRRSLFLQVVFAVSAFAVAASCGVMAVSGLLQGQVRIFGGGLHETLKWGEHPFSFVSMIVLWAGTGIIFFRMALSRN